MKTNMKIDIEKSIIYRFDDENDLSEAVLILGENGYFSDDKYFSDYIAGTLTRVVCQLEKTDYTFINRNATAYRYFIPENKVVFKEEPKKKELRPFKTIDEFFNVTGFKIGDVVRIKRIGNLNYEETAVLTGSRLYTDEKCHRIEICFSSTPRPLSVLFKYCKYFKSGEWMPFGIEE